MADRDEQRRASQRVWEAMAAGWDDRHAYFEAVARPVTARMLERLAPSPGMVLLDLAAGTGVVGFAAAALVGREGRVIVSDFSPGMVAAATRHAAAVGLGNVECRVLDAEQLDLPDAAVDGVTCRWGLMLMPGPATALRETRRVLRPGGGLACAVFAGPDANPWAAVPSRVLHDLGHLPAPQPGAAGIFALADPGRLHDLVVHAGFPDARIEEVPFAFSFDGVDDFWDFLAGAAGAVAAVLERLNAEQRAEVRDSLAARLESFQTASGVVLPAVSLVVSAH